MVKYSFIFATLFIVCRFIYAAIRVRPDKPIQWIIQDTRSYLRRYVKLLDGTICFLSVGFLFTNFSCLKSLISTFQPFSWDPFLTQLDRTVHGGHHAWEILWPLFGHPQITTILNTAYHAWFVLIYVTLFVACYDKRDPRRGMVYLVAFALTFIIGGNVVATLLSSVGPVYYQHFGFGDTFVAQMQRLSDLDQISPVWALELQERLLIAFHDGEYIAGISAMPSMHVASSVIMALFAFTYSRWLGWAFTLYAVMIQIGSVHLAWHYAIDGYLGTAVALFCWWFAKVLTRRFYSASNAAESASRAT
ncbi:phosphatase PAP2 family protein [Rhodobacteraceae bacterium B1Z28]|uniref:Phosphatase PAP2 family protein n=2 Tax=Ruegeria haliotis TaxID=2747601 RepID=A0ABX2PL10_9RHOB|nr:phosphatase PAP2 family protein [Ruegeria haliotis]